MPISKALGLAPAGLFYGVFMGEVAAGGLRFSSPGVADSAGFGGQGLVGRPAFAGLPPVAKCRRWAP